MINNNSSISFQAKFINSTQILKNAGQNIYKPMKTSFLEIDTTNKNDIAALSVVDKYWDNSFACNIYTTANALKHGIFDIDEYKIYALTKQLNNFDKLDGTQILGLAEISPKTDGAIFIDYIQVAPENIYTTQPQYKKIGSRMLDAFKNIADKITLKPNSKGSAIFYTKNEFKPTFKNQDIFEWVRD